MSEQMETALFAALAAREIRDGDVCFVGVGVPSLAAMTAKHSHAPNAVLVYESGAVDTDPPIPPLSTGSPSVVANTAMGDLVLRRVRDAAAGTHRPRHAFGRAGRSLR